MTDLVLGIDTGGTYTDGVLLDYATREVVSTTKTLTTHHDLTICILEALTALAPADPTSIRLVAISTTLATNAIAEGKGRPVGLFLLGYDPELVRRFRFDTHFATPHFSYFEGGHDLDGREQAPLDLDGILDRAKSLATEVDAFAISGYFSPFNTDHEERAAAAVREATGRPVVLGHQLSRRLNSVQRATTATLNASLLGTLHEFMAAMRQALDERGITAPLMVMGGDGALMGVERARQRPVETVHSGPAASAIGGQVLADVDRALVIDVGGTTTDLAIIDHGRVAVREEGTSVGPYNTAVRAANVRSIGLGGDSRIAFTAADGLLIGPERVQPLALLAASHPRVAAEVKAMVHRMHQRPNPDELEYWSLQREPRRPLRDGRTRQVVEMLHERPLSLPTILKRLSLLHPIQFDGQTLIREEIVAISALTPTDLLHITGEFAPGDVEAATVAASLMARLQGWTVDEFIERVMTQIAERIAAETVAFVSGHSLTRRGEYATYDDLGLWLFEENLYGASPYLGSRIALKMPLVGIGAPAGIFLPRVADILHADLILPPHYAVANAVGAVTGSVMVSLEGWITPQMEGRHVVGYMVQAGDRRRRFVWHEEAVEYARSALSEQALDDARAAGAVDPHLEVDLALSGVETTRIRVTAIGNPDITLTDPSDG